MGKHVQASGTPTSGQVPTYNGTSIVWTTPSGGGASAISVATLDQGGAAGTLSSQATASITPTANKLLLATVSIRNGNSINPTAPTLTGNGLTWVQVGTANNDNSSTSRRSVYLFRAMGASPTAGAVTITFGETETDVAWIIDQVTGASTAGTNGSGAIVQTVTGVDLTGAASTLSITLAALASSTNATYGAFGTDGAITPAAGSGYTILGHGASGTSVTADTEFKASGSTTVNFSWGVVGGLGGVAVEIAQPGTVTSVAGRTGNVTLTADDTPDGTTNKAYTAAEKTKLAAITGTNTGDQTTVTGNAGSATVLQTSRNIDGQAFNGSADITVIAPGTHAATTKATPVDADELPLVDSAASNVLKKLTWANLKATLKTYFDTLYQPLSATLTSWSGKTVPTGTVVGTTDTQVVTNKDLTSGTNTFPTLNQNTTGSAATLTTARNIAGVAFNGSANISLASTNLSDTTSIALLASTQTLTNKRISPRTGTTASSATPTINTDNVDFYSITALAAAITSFTTNLSGTPTEGQKLWLAITDNGTARAITWGTSFEASTCPLPTTTVISTRLDVGFVWNAVTSKWRCVATS